MGLPYWRPEDSPGARASGRSRVTSDDSFWLPLYLRCCQSVQWRQPSRMDLITCGKRVYRSLPDEIVEQVMHYAQVGSSATLIFAWSVTRRAALA